MRIYEVFLPTFEFGFFKNKLFFLAFYFTFFVNSTCPPCPVKIKSDGSEIS